MTSRVVWFSGGRHADHRDLRQLAWWQQLSDRLWHLVLPTLVITTGGLSSLVRVVRGQVLDFLQADFIRTARAKGLSQRVVIYKHLLRNAISPVISGIGTVLPELVTGAGLVEFVYRWPGITPGFVAAIQQKDSTSSWACWCCQPFC